MEIKNFIKGYVGKDWQGMYGKKEEVELIIKSHWNSKQLVILEIDGKEYCFRADELSDGITNALNKPMI